MKKIPISRLRSTFRCPSCGPVLTVSVLMVMPAAGDGQPKEHSLLLRKNKKGAIVLADSLDDVRDASGLSSKALIHKVQEILARGCAVRCGACEKYISVIEKSGKELSVLQELDAFIKERLA